MTRLVLVWITLATCYRAAVLQHTHFKVANGPQATMLANLKAYDDAMGRAGAEVDIFVTPEVGLGHDELGRHDNAEYGETIPAPGSIFCLTGNRTSTPVMVEASCVARRRGTALVIGTIDLRTCIESSDPACPSDGRYIYNTALVFDAEGRLIAKYWKYHLFTLCPDCFNRPSSPQVVSFPLFNETFGLLICFDSLFPEPARSLYARGARNIIFPTSWENLPPILNANSWQQAISRNFANKGPVVLLAANNGNGRAKSGSGIYQGGTVLESYFNYSSTNDYLMVANINGESLSLVADVAVVPSADNVSLEKKSKFLKPICGFLHCQVFEARGSGRIELHRGNVSCSLDYNVTGPGDYYALAIHSGLLWFGEFIRSDFCAVVHCDSGPICLLPDPLLKRVYDTAGTVFRKIDLNVSFSDSTEAVFPLLSVNQGQLVQPKKLKIESDSLSYRVETENQSIVSIVAWGLPWKN